MTNQPHADQFTGRWAKSSYSGGDGNECVEVAHLGSWTGIRDTKNPEPVLVVQAEEFARLIRHLTSA